MSDPEAKDWDYWQRLAGEWVTAMMLGLTRPQIRSLALMLQSVHKVGQNDARKAECK